MLKPIPVSPVPHTSGPHDHERGKFYFRKVPSPILSQLEKKQLEGLEMEEAQGHWRLGDRFPWRSEGIWSW